MDDVGLSPTNRKVSIETDSFLNDIKFHLGQRVRVLASYCQHHDAGAGVLNDAEEALVRDRLLKLLIVAVCRAHW